MQNSRIKNSIYNSFSNLLINLSTTILSFVVRTFFIKILGEQCLGIDGLFSNLLALLSVVELGFSSAISFSLYKPLAVNDTKKINELMYYFKKVYTKIAFVILFFGILLIPFLNDIVKGYEINENIYLIYTLYLINTVSTYFTSYMLILIEADQKSYKLTYIRIIFNFLTYGIQILILILYNNFILYLVIQFIFRLIERIAIYIYIKKQYKKLELSNNYMLSNCDKMIIKNNIKGIALHKFGEYAVNGTDNILISSIINISMTGIYSNYLSIISIMRNLIGSVISSTTSSFGNLNVLENHKTKKNVFELINFLCYLLTGISVVGLFFCLNIFIQIWIGSSYVLNNMIVCVICINFFLNCIMLPITAVKNSTGLYYIDRYVPIIQMILNFVISIVLGIKFGLIGILLGTTISSILTVNLTKPYVIYKYIFKQSSVDYFRKLIYQVFLILISIIINKFILKMFFINNLYIKFIVYGLLSTLIYLSIFIVMNFNSREFKYYFKKFIFKRGVTIENINS